MGLETGTYINDLVVTNPVGTTDDISQMDNHLRLIKTVLKNTIPFTGAVTATHTELNRAAITVLGLVEASKLVSADANAFVNFPTGKGIGDANGNEIFKFTTVASAINEITVEPATTGNKPQIYQTSSGAEDLGIDIEGVELHNGVVTGAFVGNVAGNVTGNLTGNVTSVGSNSMAVLTVSTTLSMPADSVGATEIAANAVTIDELSTVAGSSSSTVLGAGAVWSPPSNGWYVLHGDATNFIKIEAHHATFGWSGGSLSNTNSAHLIVSGSTRVRNTDTGGQTLYYKKFAG